MRIREFIETTDGLIFAVASYLHPRDRGIAFLRYYPHPDGEREIGGVKYKKTGGTEDSFSFLAESYPEYIFDSEVTGSRLQAVPIDSIKSKYLPHEGLAKIYENPITVLDRKTIALSEFFSDIPLDKKGVTGSALMGLTADTSDIDFVIYGLENHRKAIRKLRATFEEEATTGGGEKESNIRPLAPAQWKAAYEKRFPGGSKLSFDEFMWHESRKGHKGMIDGTVFDVLLVREPKEVEGSFEDYSYKRLDKVVLRCTVAGDTLAYDSPSVYEVECPDDEEIEEVVSYTHTYAGQGRKGEILEVSGYLEEVAGKRSYKRVIVGTTREAPGEYIKVVKP